MQGKRQWKMKDWISLLKQNNYYFKRQGKGSHTIWTNGKETISFQLNVNCMQARRLIKEYNLRME